MQIVGPDILGEARGLSAVVTVPALILGFFLWLYGWRGHRFWIVLAATIAAGVLGLSSGPSYGTNPLVAGLLLAVAAGALALALVRVVAFLAGGVAALLLVRLLGLSWNDTLVTFLVGGIAGLLLFRIWTMALSSLAGTLLVAYSALCLGNSFGIVDAVALAETKASLLNCGVALMALLGLIVQFLMDRRRERLKARRNLSAQADVLSGPGERRWWRWGQRPERKAG